MAELPAITLVGILVADPELCITPTGAAVATFTVAANGRCYDPVTGQWINVSRARLAWPATSQHSWRVLGGSQ